MRKSLKLYYNSIHSCSVYSWSRARKHSNFSFLKMEHFNTSSVGIPLDNTIQGEQAYMTLLTELWFEFGQSKELKKEIELRVDLLEMNLLFLNSGDKSLLNDIKLIAADLKFLLDSSADAVDYDFDKEVGMVAKHLGRAINQKKTSVFEYYAATKV